MVDKKSKKQRIFKYYLLIVNHIDEGKYKPQMSRGGGWVSIIFGHLLFDPKKTYKSSNESESYTSNLALSIYPTIYVSIPLSP